MGNLESYLDTDHLLDEATTGPQTLSDYPILLNNYFHSNRLRIDAVEEEKR